MVHCQDEITEPEKQLIVQLRERVENELPEPIRAMDKDDQDLYLVRWIRARDLHLNNATKMLRTSLEWRKERNAEQATKLVIHPYFHEKYFHSYGGTDKSGRPVLLIPFSSWDFRKVLNQPDRLNEFDDFVTNFFENVCNRIRAEHLRRNETGHPPVTQVVILLDVQNYPYGQLISFGAMKKVLQMASTYEIHYPEILYKGVFINCPSYFGLFLTMLKPVMAPKTLGKLECYPKMAEWQKDMVEFLDRDTIPEKYGGTAKDTL